MQNADRPHAAAQVEENESIDQIERTDGETAVHDRAPRGHYFLPVPRRALLFFVFFVFFGVARLAAAFGRAAGGVMTLWTSMMFG